MKTIIILSIAFASVIFLSFVGFAKCEETVISISPSSDTLPQSQIGKTFQININISSVTDLWQWKVRLNWNPNVLNFTSMSEGSFLKSAGSTLFLYAPPTQGSGCITELSDTLLENTSVNGNGVLVTVTFQVLAAGQSYITMNETLLAQPLSGSPLSHPQITHTVDNGQLVVVPEFQNWVLPIVMIIVTIPMVILTRKRLKPTRRYDFCNTT